MLKKTYTKTGRTCRVTFKLAPDFEARNARLVGDFNGWSDAAAPMKRLRDGSFSATVSLEAGQQYRFRYLLDNQRWENDPAADAYQSNPYGTNDSIVAV